MLPRAELHDPRAVAEVTRPLRALAWWRSPSIAAYAAGHCAVAGVVQLLALLAELARTGRPMPSLGTMAWAAIGLALIAAVPATLTLVARSVRTSTSRRARIWEAATVGVVFYGALPWIALGGSFGAVALLAPVAIAWHLTLAGAPRAP